MTGTPPTAPPPGWYPDPAGSAQNRWWTGSSWGDLQPYQPMQSHAAYSPFGGAQPYGSDPAGYGAQQYSYYGQPLRAPAGTDPSTSQIWIIAFWPLLILLNMVVYIFLGGLDNQYLMTGTTNTTADIIDGALTLMWYLAMVPVAYLDSRELARRGVPRPFGWGWAFLPLVYVIGRAVTVYSRTQRGLAPLFVWIGAVVVGRILTFGIGFAVGLAQL